MYIGLEILIFNVFILLNNYVNILFIFTNELFIYTFSVIRILKDAANNGHPEAFNELYILNLIGWNVPDFPSVLDKASSEVDDGNPRIQFVRGYLHSTGLFKKFSTPHSLIYLTFSALGGDHFANMALVSKIKL